MFKWPIKAEKENENIIIRVITLKLKNGISRLSNEVFTCNTWWVWEVKIISCSFLYQNQGTRNL